MPPDDAAHALRHRPRPTGRPLTAAGHDLLETGKPRPRPAGTLTRTPSALLPELTRNILLWIQFTPFRWREPRRAGVLAHGSYDKGTV
jgi:hypothetical protein